MKNKNKKREETSPISKCAICISLSLFPRPKWYYSKFKIIITFFNQLWQLWDLFWATRSKYEWNPTIRKSRYIKNTLSYDTAWWWFICQHTEGLPPFFAAYAQASKINLVRGYGAFPRRRCYAREQFVVPDKKGETVSRRDYW